MTYGWAILIIAVVLVALFQLGVFNANNFAPKAPPGSCKVFRPNGPGTTSYINLEGICNGEIPQYVAQFSGVGSSPPANYINVGNSNRLNMVDSFTITAWVDPLSNSTGAIYEQQGCNGQYELIIAGGGATLVILPAGSTISYGNGGSVAPLPTNKWTFVAATFNLSYDNVYINGHPSGSCTGNPGGACKTGTPLTSNPGGYGYIGTRIGCPQPDVLNGSLANVQLYNTSLSETQIRRLYLEGIGGAPIDLQNLVGWWPLNGNANDYSGNGYDGWIIGNVLFVSNWWSSYTPP